MKKVRKVFFFFFVFFLNNKLFVLMYEPFCLPFKDHLNKKEAQMKISTLLELNHPNIVSRPSLFLPFLNMSENFLLITIIIIIRKDKHKTGF